MRFLVKHNELKISPLELQLDEKTNKPFVYITPVAKYMPHKYTVDQLIGNEPLLLQLDRKSIEYLYYTYGILRATEKNNLFILEEILYSTKQIRVKNLHNMMSEVWSKDKFDNDYIFLDKQSLKTATEFFCQILNQNGKQEKRDSHLKLVK